MKGLDEQSLLLVVTVVGPILLSIVAFFLKRIVAKNDQILVQTSNNSTNIQILAHKLGAIEDAARDVLVLKEEVKDMQEELAVTKRNLTTAFKYTDDLKESVQALLLKGQSTEKALTAQKNRTHYLVQKVTILRSLLEREKIIDVRDDPWILPEE